MATLETATLRARQEAYRCLAALFCEPDLGEFQRQRIGDRLRGAVEAWASGVTRAPGANGVIGAARAVESAVAAATELDLRRTYARLFVGPGPLAAPPYGSVYLDDERSLMGPSTLRVLEAYAAAGLDVDADVHEAPDHVAIELEFLQLLDWKALQVQEEAPTGQDEARRCRVLRRDFLERLVSPWVSPLSAAVREAAPGSPYAAFAACLEAVVALDVKDEAPVAG